MAKFTGIKKVLFFAVTVLLLLSLNVFAQSSDELSGVKVYTMEGWIVKAKNNTKDDVRYSFTYTTEGTDRSGNVVSSINETYENGVLNSEEERSLFTAPQDPKKEITYKITNIKIKKVEVTTSSASKYRRRS